MPVALTQVKYLDVCAGVYFMHRISGATACLAIKVITLNEDAVFAEATDPNVTFTVKV